MIPRNVCRINAILLFLTSLVAASSLAAQQTEPPPPLPERPLEFPGFEELTLDNGLRVVIVSYGTQPVMSARLYVPGGRSAEEPDEAGLASLAATVLTRGTELRTAREISEEIEGVGGSLNAVAGQDFFSVSAVALTEHMETAFGLLEDVVESATFPEAEVELARTQRLSALQAELGQPQTIASRRFAEIIYGDDHPYGFGPTPETVGSLHRDDLVSYRDRLLRPEEALLVVAGRVERDEVEALVRRRLGDWSGPQVVDFEVPEPEERTDAEIYLVHRPGSAQSVVAIGHLGTRPDTPDYFALQVMNRVLGGGADARLFRILREERGWTYGAYSQFTRPAARGHFVAQAEVRPEVTDSTVVEILSQMRRLREEPVPEAEMEAALNYLAGSFPLRLETADQVASQLASTLLLDLPLERLTRYPQHIREVNGEEVQRVAREYLAPGQAAVVVVGDGGVLAEDLESIAPVEFFDVEGNPLAREEVVRDDEPTAWNAERLESGRRRYEVMVEDSPMGSAEYRLEREGSDWVSTVVVTALGSDQETRLRFSADEFAPKEILQESSGGPVAVSADLTVEDGRLTGVVNLPAQLGGITEYDRVLAPGVLFPGMDEYALAISDLAEGSRIGVPYLDLTRGEVVRLEARVLGREDVTVPAGTFSTWRVELSGGGAPMTLFLRADAPHVMVRQEFTGQPVRFDLIGMTP